MGTVWKVPSHFEYFGSTILMSSVELIWQNIISRLTTPQVPDLASCNFWFPPKLKKKIMKGSNFLEQDYAVEDFVLKSLRDPVISLWSPKDNTASLFEVGSFFVNGWILFKKTWYIHLSKNFNLPPFSAMINFQFTI